MITVGELFDLSGKVALVVGAGGLGEAIAGGLFAAGAEVAVADKSPQRAERLAARLRKDGRGTRGYGVDVTISSEVSGLVSTMMASFGRIDVLVNAFGITHRAAAEDFPEQLWRNISDVNLKGTFLCSRESGRQMLEQGGGSIINLSSIAGTVGIKNTVAYAASKGGVNQLTRTMGIEWAKRGVRVNAIAPSWFETEMGSRIRDVDGLYAGDRKPQATLLLEETVERVPVGRMGMPEEIVGAAVFLASDASRMVTGHILAVDGGYLAQ